MNSSDNLYAMRHSLAHITAAAVKRLWPSAQFGVGPVVDNGFYYDIDLGKIKISEEDFARIEQEMQAIIKEGQPFEHFTKPIAEAVVWAEEAGQPYKAELLHDLQRSGTTVASELDVSELGLAASNGESKVDEVSFYKNGDFTDLCRGPHVSNTKEVGAFKLLRVSGAYWRGKDTNPQMQRLYGVGFATKEELQRHLELLVEAKKRDHRKLGQELDLFVFSDLVGAGLPLFTPRGTIMRRKLDEFVQEMRDEYDYQEVSIPHITKKDTYIASGHWQKFQHELFRIKTREGHEFAMKPMNCPHHAQIYASRARSYRELPVRYRETTVCYRDEQTGELSGLSRVRAFAQDDAHVFCRNNQVEEEVAKVWDIIDRFYSAFDFAIKVRLSTHDVINREAYLGSDENWSSAELQLRSIVEQKVGKDYVEGVGEAAFYGPKIDFIATDALGRELQVATIQVDFNQPEGFDLTCVNESGEKERIVMVHAAIMGSIDRFLAVYIEHCAGLFPVWLSPEQVRLVTVNQEQSTIDLATKIASEGRELGLRITRDDASESVGKKIRAAELARVPYVIVIGQKEVDTAEVMPRIRRDLAVSEEAASYQYQHFLKTVAHEAKARTRKSSL